MKYEVIGAICAICGNPIGTDVAANSGSCKVCGKNALWEQPIDNSASFNAECEICGNPIEGKNGESYKCAVCGFGGCASYKCGQDKIVPTLTILTTSDVEKNDVIKLEDKGSVSASADNNYEIFKEKNAEKINSVRVNTYQYDGISQTLEHDGEIDREQNRKSKIVAITTNKNAISANKKEIESPGKSPFENIFIVPAPLSSGRLSQPDVSFVMRGKSGLEAVFDSPLVNTSNHENIAVFNTIAYYVGCTNLSLKEAFSEFKENNKERLIGISVLPYRLEEDLIFAQELECDFIELSFIDIVPPGMVPFDIAKSILNARGIINRRNLDLYMIVKTAFITSADAVKALCLGADAVSVNRDVNTEADFITELKEYCGLCAHDSIRQFSRRDITFK